MNHIEGYFKGVRNANIYYQGWLPDGDVSAALIIVHGLGEHSGRYVNMVSHFIPLGYAFYGLDHIGHGKSEGEREMVDRFADYTDTLSIYVNMVKGWQPGKPIILLGQSMGGLIVPYYLLDHQSDFKAAVIFAPAIKIPDSISPITITVGKILSSIAPKVGILRLDTTGLSHDPDVVKAYVNDPLVFHGKTPARLAAEMLKAMQRVTAEVDEITLSFITLQGSADRIVDPGGAQLLFDKASSKDKAIKIYEGFYHEVFNEPERAIVLKDMETWLKAHV